MESSWRPPTSSTKRPRRRAVSATARGRARCCRSRKSAATAPKGMGRRGIRGSLSSVPCGTPRRCASPGFRHHFLRVRAERVPVVWAVAEGDVDPGAAGVAERGDHLPGLLHGSPQPARTLRALGAPVLPEDLLAAGGPAGVGSEIEPEIDGTEDRPGVATFLLAPLVQDLALRDPLLGADVGGVP